MWQKWFHPEIIKIVFPHDPKINQQKRWAVVGSLHHHKDHICFSNDIFILYKYRCRKTIDIPVCTALDGSGSFKDGKPIREVRCCEWWMDRKVVGGNTNHNPKRQTDSARPKYCSAPTTHAKKHCKAHPRRKGWEGAPATHERKKTHYFCIQFFPKRKSNPESDNVDLHVYHIGKNQRFMCSPKLSRIQSQSKRHVGGTARLLSKVNW